MKILFIVPYPSAGPCNRVRVEQYLPFLEERGHQCALRPFVDSTYYKILYKSGYTCSKIKKFILSSLSRIKDIAESSSFDILFIHREAFPYGPAFLEKFLKIRNKPIIFDFDDALHLYNQSFCNKSLRFLKHPAKTSEILKIADLVIAGNNYLAEYARRFSGNVKIIPSCVDMTKYTSKQWRPRRKGERVVLGWIGTTSSARYIRPLANILKTLAKKHNILVKMVGGYFPIKEVPVEYKEWNLANEMDELKSFDIGLMPMEKEEWARGKCGFKLIQYMGVGIPAIGTAFGANLDIIEDGVNGFVADRTEDWIDKMSMLIEDQELGVRMGANGRRLVSENYSLQVYASVFAEAIESLR